MKIGISCYPTFGGSGIIATELGMGLAERGHEIHFITYGIPGRLKTYRPGIHFHEVSVPDYPLFDYAPYSLALASKMAECAQSESLDLIHAHYAIPHAIAALLARDMVGGNRLKVITTMHGTDVTLVGKDPSFMPITRYAIERSDAITAVSHFLHDEICRTFKCESIKDIYNFIDPRDFNGLNRENTRKLFVPDGEKLLVHVSNFRKIKRIDDVIEIFLRVRKKIKVKLALVGKGPELNSAVKTAKNEGAEKDLIVLGNRETVNEIIASADVLLMPSESESFGMAALEAMACGVPPVTSDIGGLPEVVEDGITGFLVPVGDVEQMAEKTLFLLRNEGKWLEMSKKARQTAFERFNITIALDAYLELYEAVLA